MVTKANPNYVVIINYCHYDKRNLRFNTTVIRDQLPFKANLDKNIALHFYTFIPAMRDHLSYKTILGGPMVGWSYIAGYTY